MTVVARFKLESLSDAGSDTVQATFRAHVGKGSEDFCKYTPWGELKMGITKGAKALDQLVAGFVYELAFNPVDLSEANSAVKL